MAQPEQKALRWEPIEDLPETTCTEVAIESARTGELRLVLRYSQIVGNPDRDLVLEFSDVRAFQTRWDGDGPRLREECEVPACNHPRFHSAWPLIQVENSPWIASEDFSVSRFFAEADGQGEWNHFRIGSEDRSVDVMARGPVSASWRNLNGSNEGVRP